MQKAAIWLLLILLSGFVWQNNPAIAQDQQRTVAFNPEIGCKRDVAKTSSEHAYCRKYELIQEFKEDERWYDQQKDMLNYLWIGGSIVALVLTALTSFLIAVGYGEGGRHKIFLASLPALAALITTLMAQFQIRELWELREMGRFRMRELIAEARLVTANDEVKMRELLKHFEDERIKLARNQASQFFSNIGGVGRGSAQERASSEPKQQAPDGPVQK